MLNESVAGEHKLRTSLKQQVVVAAGTWHSLQNTHMVETAVPQTVQGVLLLVLKHLSTLAVHQ